MAEIYAASVVKEAHGSDRSISLLVLPVIMGIEFSRLPYITHSVS